MNIMLLVLLLVCHWMADYTHLSRPYMLSAKRLGKPVGPILDHASVHGILMFIVLFFMQDNVIIAGTLAFFQIATHFAIDVLKGRLNGWYPSLQNPANTYHWYVFGLDQMLHVFVIIFMWWFVIK